MYYIWRQFKMPNRTLTSSLFDTLFKDDSSEIVSDVNKLSVGFNLENNRYSVLDLIFLGQNFQNMGLNHPAWVPAVKDFFLLLND